MTTYRIDFDPTWKIPPVTVDYSDRQEADRTVAEHATPYLKPVLAEKGRPELADCVFQLDEDMAFGQFVHMNLAEGKGARFCPARLLPTDLAPDICGDLNDDEVCEREPRHDGDHTNGYATVGWPNAYAKAA